MYHFFAEHENISDDYIDIRGGDVNHIKNVIRLKVGDEVLISSGDNYDYLCSIELIIQKMVELGVYEIVPVSMKRSVVRLDEKKARTKTARWNAISESAAKQSKRSIIPSVSEVLSFKQALERAKELDMLLLPYECAEGMAYTRMVVSKIKPGQSVGIFIGPEGGFDGDELKLAREAECNIITLGKRILRTETAGMMLMSVIMYNMEE